MPVVACVGATAKGELLNVNADTLASHLAVGLRAARLVIAGGTAGVLDADGPHHRARHARATRRGSCGGHGQQGDGGQAAGVPRCGAAAASATWSIGNGRDAELQARWPTRKAVQRRLHTGGAMNTNLDDIRAREQQYVLQTYRRQPVAFVQGQGARLFDADGPRVPRPRVGHRRHVARPRAPGPHGRASPSRRRTLLHTSNLYFHPFQAEAAARLAALSGLQRTFFCNSGTEANEACLKFARRYWHTLGAKDRVGYVALENGVRGPHDGRAVGDAGTSTTAARSSRSSGR